MDFVSKNFDFKPGERCVVIGEIGVNHNRNEEILFRLVDEGIAAGLDIIKLQRFNSSLEISRYAALADYQAAAGMRDSQLKMAQELELPDELLIKAFEYCKRKKVGFLCTAFDRESVDFLSDRLGCKSIKVPSPEISNRPLLEQMAQKFDSLLISTGASTMEEVNQALNWVKSSGGGKNELALMHCTSQYPASINQANLRAIVTMREEFGLPVGYSDHTLGQTAAIVVTALGGAMIEKHYTLDKNMPGPDHQASADIAELKAFIKAVHDAHASLGDGIKKPTEEETETRPKIRKSVVCGIPHLPAGTILDMSLVEIKRPWVDGAVEPYELDIALGRKLKISKTFDEPIMRTDIE